MASSTMDSEQLMLAERLSRQSLDMDTGASNETHYDGTVPDGLRRSLSITRDKALKDASSSRKEVHFDPKIKIIELPERECFAQTAPQVTFDDRVIDIDSPAAMSHRRESESPQSGKKRVKFSIMKHTKQPVSPGRTLLQLLRQSPRVPFTRSVSEKKHVKFGCLKSQKPSRAGTRISHRDCFWDEEICRRLFKRQRAKEKEMAMLTPLSDGLEDTDWEST